MDFAVPEHRFSVPGDVREEQLHTVTSGTATTPFNKLLSLCSDGGSASQAPWPALERKGSATSVAPKPALTAAQKQELALAGARSQKVKRGQKRSSPSEDGTGAVGEDGAAEEEELDMSKLSPEEREQLANADAKEAKRLRRLLRNRCSAQLARERRKVYISELEAKVAAHELRIEELEAKLALTEQQNATLRRIIRTMKPPEGAEPVALPPVDTVRLREKAAAAAGLEAGAAADKVTQGPGNVHLRTQEQHGSLQQAQAMDMDMDQEYQHQHRQQVQQSMRAAQQAIPQQLMSQRSMPQLSMAPPAAPVPARSLRMSTPEPPTPQLPTVRQQQEAMHLHPMQQQLSQQQQQQHGVAPQLPPLPPASRPAQLSMQQRVEHSMDLGPFSVAYKASREAAKLHQQKEQEEQQQQQRKRYQERLPQPQQQNRYQDPPLQQEQYGSTAGMQYDCDSSALFGRGALPVPVVPKSQLQQLLMQQQLQQQQEEEQQQQQEQVLYAQSVSQGGHRFEARQASSEAHSHGNNTSSLHVVPTNSWRSHSRPSHSNPMPQPRMQQAKQHESYSFPGQYDADAVAQKYSDALGVVPKRHRSSSHASSRRARDVVHVVPDVGAMSFPPDELLAALLSA